MPKLAARARGQRPQLQHERLDLTGVFPFVRRRNQAGPGLDYGRRNPISENSFRENEERDRKIPAATEAL